VLAKLDSKQQALVLGHAVPMPVVIQTRPYDDTFYQELGYLDEQRDREKILARAQAARRDLGL
jgi:DNA helicase HerA-like ATPase